MIEKTGERMIPSLVKSKEEYLIYLRHLFAYDFAEQHIKPNSVMLEVGTGEGYGTNRISKSKKVKCIKGIDVDYQSIKNAQEKYKSSKIEFIAYDGVKFPVKSNSVDVVISFQVIEHVSDDSQYVSEVYRVLKKGGVFFVTTPNRLYRLKEEEKPWNRFHLREYSEDTFRDVLTTKFSDVTIYGLKGSEEIQNIEFERVRKIRKLISIDPLNLRRFLPEFIKKRVTKLFNKASFENNDIQDFTKKYKISQHHLVEEGLETSLDLLAICKK